MDFPPPQSPGERIAKARKEKSLSQVELARAAAITRQALNQIERGAVLPRVDTALRLAVALDRTVEDFFGVDAGACRRVPVRVLGPALHEGARVDLARIDESWIAAPSDAVERLGSGLGPADGRMSVSPGGVFAELLLSPEELEGNLFVAGCDPALRLVCEAVTRRMPRGRCVWIPCGSQAALRHLAEGTVHVAGIHFGDSDAANLGEVARWGLADRCAIVRLGRWLEGWMFRKGDPFRDAEEFASGGRRLANREEGSACRLHLDALLAQRGLDGRAIPGYQSESRNHVDCARRIAQGDADVGLGCEPVARLTGLEFASLKPVAFDLVIRRDMRDRRAVSILLELLVEGRFARELAGIPGYEVEEIGRAVAH